MKRQAKPIEYAINENGCWICTNHITDKDGYPMKTINRKTVRLSRLAYVQANNTSFENIKGLQVRHICDTPSCINPAHLLIGTARDNTNDMLERQRQTKGTEVHTAKLTEAQVLEIIADTTLTLYELAAKYDVHNSQISAIQTGRTWKHIPRPNGLYFRGTTRGEKHGYAKLTEVQVLEILHDTTSSLKQLAEKYGVSFGNISCIKKKKSWKYLHERTTMT